MADTRTFPRPAHCAECVAEWADSGLHALEVRVGDETCRVCGMPGCAWHGREYRNGWEHVRCHEAPDMTRAEEGKY